SAPPARYTLSLHDALPISGLVAIQPQAQSEHAGTPDRCSGLLQEAAAAVGGCRFVGHGSCRGAGAPRSPQALSTLTAHFLKSVSLESGQVASRTSLLTRRPSSKNGMNTRPRGGLLRPRVSTLATTSPRREAMRACMPRCSPRALASSGCM